VILLIFIFIGLWSLPTLATYLHLRAMSRLLIAFLLGGIWLVVSLSFISNVFDEQKRGN